MRSRSSKNSAKAWREQAVGSCACTPAAAWPTAFVEGPHDYDGVLAVLSVIAAVAGEVISLLTGD